ncbi:MAG: hypothetical protein U9Q67_02945 [Patescibacteria group bacterium]|nr:hypothetical protein [Patescibacteria group bacterium]
MKTKLAVITLVFISFLFVGAGKVNATATTISACGDDFSTAVVLQKGEYLGDAINEGEGCYYYIDVPNGHELKIDYRLTGEYFFGNVTLYDSSKDELAGSDEDEGTLRWLGSKDGESENRYYLVIENSYASDSFVLDIDTIDCTDAGTGTDAGGDFGDSTEINYGEHTGYLSSFIYGTEGGNDDDDYYKLAVEYGDRVTVRVTPEGDFFAGCAVYDNKRSELFNDEGLDLTSGEIIQESFEIVDDGYIFVVVKWPYFGGLESRIDKYNLLVTNETVDNLGGEISTDAQDIDQDIDSEETSNTRNLLIIAFSIMLIVLLIVFIVVIILLLAKKNKSSAKQTKLQQQESEPIIVDEGSNVEESTVKKEEPEITEEK